MKLYTERYPVEREQGQQVKMATVLVHGAGDHCGRYEHVIKALNEAGFPVVTGDLPGHGRTEGLAGHLDSFDEYLDSVEQWMQQAVALADTGRVALIGHSMGGLIVLRYLQERAADHPEIVTAVVTSPCLRLAMEVPGWKRWLGDRLAQWSPRLRLESGISPNDISRTPEICTAYAADPHCGGKVSVRWFQELNRAMEETRAAVGKIECPLLIMQGGDDRIVDARESALFYQGLPPQGESRYLDFPACYHELFNEPEQQQVIEQMVTWLQRQTATF